MPCYIYRKCWFGVQGDLHDALTDLDAPTTPEGDRLTTQDFKAISTEEYDNTILDLRYADGEWQQ